MALALTLLTESSGGTSTDTSASISPTAGGVVLAIVAMRSANGLTMLTEVPQIVGNGLTWTQQGTSQLYQDGGGTLNYVGGVFLGTGTPSAGTAVLSCVSGRVADRWEFVYIQVTGQSATPVRNIVLATTGAGGASSAIAPGTLPAFGSVNNYTLLLAATAAENETWTKETGSYADLSTAVTVKTYATYLNGNDTTPTATTGAGVHHFEAGLEIEAAASVTAVVTGTAVPTITEADVVAGGKTIIITLTGDTWVTSGANFDAQRQNIINGIDSAQAEAHGWDVEVKGKIAVTDVVRTSNTIATVTLDAEAAYDITATETITVTVPSSALAGGGGAVIATPTFTVTATQAAATGAATVHRLQVQPHFVANAGG